VYTGSRNGPSAHARFEDAFPSTDVKDTTLAPDSDLVSLNIDPVVYLSSTRFEAGISLAECDEIVVFRHALFLSKSSCLSRVYLTDSRSLYPLLQLNRSVRPHEVIDSAESVSMLCAHFFAGGAITASRTDSKLT
jgi:hypothetical protein